MSTLLDEVFALNSQLCQHFRLADKRSLRSKLEALSPEEGQILRGKCLASGAPEHLNLLGECLRWSCGLARNREKAVELFQQSANLGDPLGMYDLGLCLWSGDGIAKNKKKAVEWFQKSADLGNPMAMNKLGRCLQNGTGIIKNEMKATEWYRKSADLGYPPAMSNLGQALRDGSGIPKNETMAIDWLCKAKTAVSYWNLGQLFQKKDHACASYYYYKALVTYTEEPAKAKCRKMIDSPLRLDHRIEILGTWTTLEDENERLRAENEALKAELARCGERIETIITLQV